MKNTKLNKLAQYKMTLLAAVAVMGMALTPIADAYATIYAMYCDTVPEGTTLVFKGIGAVSGKSCVFIVIGTQKKAEKQKNDDTKTGG